MKGAALETLTTFIFALCSVAFAAGCGVVLLGVLLAVVA